MAKQRYDNDYEDDDDDVVVPRDKGKGKASGAGSSDAPAAPEPIIFEDLVEQFRDEYSPASFEEDADEQMDMAGIREYFGAWPQYGYPDAVPTYIEMLRRYGFRLKVNFEHEPVLFLKRNEIPLMDELEP